MRSDAARIDFLGDEQLRQHCVREGFRGEDSSGSVVEGDGEESVGEGVQEELEDGEGVVGGLFESSVQRGSERDGGYSEAESA